MSKNLLVKFFLLLALLSINIYASGSAAKKPVIDRVFNYKGTWYIRYQDVILSDDEATERVIVDGTLDRVVNIGNSEERGFPLINKSYDPTECHQLVIEIYSGINRIVSQSDVFEFGDLTKCNEVTPPTLAKPVIDRIFNYKGRWYIRYQDVNVPFDNAYEKMVVNGVVDRVIQNGRTEERGFSLAENYDATACNEGQIKIYDGLDVVVAQSDIFKFGDLTKCEGVDLTNGLIAHYKLEGNADDSSGNGNHGTERGVVSYETGVIGQSAHFDSSYVTVVSSSSLIFTDELSVTAFIKPSSLSGGWVSLFFGKASALDFNKYNFVTWTFKQGVLNIYLDGVLLDTQNINTALLQQAVAGVLDVGANSPRATNFFVGELDDVRFYNRAISQAEMTEIYGLAGN